MSGIRIASQNKNVTSKQSPEQSEGDANTNTNTKPSLQDETQYFTNERTALLHFFAWYLPTRHQQQGAGAEAHYYSSEAGFTVALGVKFWHSLWVGTLLEMVTLKRRRLCRKNNEDLENLCWQLNSPGYLDVRMSTTLTVKAMAQLVASSGRRTGLITSKSGLRQFSLDACFRGGHQDVLGILHTDGKLLGYESLMQCAEFNCPLVARLLCEGLVTACRLGLAQDVDPTKLLAIGPEFEFLAPNEKSPSQAIDQLPQSLSARYVDQTQHPVFVAFDRRHDEVLRILCSVAGCTIEAQDRFILNSLPKLRTTTLEQLRLLVECGLDIDSVQGLKWAEPHNPGVTVTLPHPGEGGDETTSAAQVTTALGKALVVDRQDGDWAHQWELILYLEGVAKSRSSG